MVPCLQRVVRAEPPVDACIRAEAFLFPGRWSGGRGADEAETDRNVQRRRKTLGLPLILEDRLETVRILEAFREIFQEVIGNHRSRILDSTGDNDLCEFESAVDAIGAQLKSKKNWKRKMISLLNRSENGVSNKEWLFRWAYRTGVNGFVI